MGRGIEKLAGLNHLNGELIIYNLEDVRDGDEAKKAKLEDKRHLCHLRFVWTHFRMGRLDRRAHNDEEDILEGLQPHPKLEKLERKKYVGGKFPSWIMSKLLPLINLKQVQLCSCNRCEAVPTLGHLPNLRQLEIDGMDSLKCIGAEFYGYDLI